MKAATSEPEEHFAVADADHQRRRPPVPPRWCPGSSAHANTNVKWPPGAEARPSRSPRSRPRWARGDTARTPGGRRPRCRCRSTNSTPVASSSARSTAKFSMMPLWTTAILPAASRCGCALRSVGLPWVAQRVWPIPVLPIRPARSQPPRGPPRGWPVAQHAYGPPFRPWPSSSGNTRGVVAPVLHPDAEHRRRCPWQDAARRSPTIPHMTYQGSADADSPRCELRSSGGQDEEALRCVDPSRSAPRSSW